MSMETLADYVRRTRSEKNISTQQVEANSKGKITDAYVWKIENGDIKNVSLQKLQALAKGLGVPEDEIFAVARGVKPKTSRIVEEIVNYLTCLPTARQKDVLNMVKMYYSEVRKQGDFIVKILPENEWVESSAEIKEGK